MSNQFLMGLIGAVAVLLAGSLVVSGAQAATLEDAIAQTAADVVKGARIAPGGRNIAIISYAPAVGEPLKLGEQLRRKLRIQAFDKDAGHELRFVSEGQVTQILVKEGMKQQNALFDSSQSAKLGHLLTADKLVHGSYEVLGAGEVEIVTYLVDVKTGVTLAQSVQRAEGVSTHLLLPVAAEGTATSYVRFSSAALTSDPEAAKQYRMAEVFEKRDRPERARELLNGVMQNYPKSLEAVQAQAKLMREDLAVLRQNKDYDEGFYQVVATLPPRYKKLQAFEQLQHESALWLGELARVELSGGSEEQAIAYYEKSKALGLSPEEARELDTSLRASRVRIALRNGQRDSAELMLVEWEVDQPDSSVRKQLQKEFDRPKGMVTIASGEVNGVKVDSVNMDIYETTNAEFLEFVRANPAYRKSRMTVERNDQDYLKRWSGDFEFSDSLRTIPVVFVSAVVAEAYCTWRKKRLPTSLEWGLAAGEGRRLYPWGDQDPTQEIANFNRALLGEPLPGDSHPQGATPEGVHHMAGNVWELTSTRIGHETQSRGGSYYDGGKILRNNNRELSTDPHNYSSRFTGFRCAQ